MGNLERWRAQARIGEIEPSKYNRPYPVGVNRFLNIGPQELRRALMMSGIEGWREGEPERIVRGPTDLQAWRV